MERPIAAPLRHFPVMAQEALDLLDPQPGQVCVDATCGLLGHSRLILERLGDQGKLIGIERDPRIMQQARELSARDRLARRSLILVQGAYADLGAILRRLGISRIDGILFDLGANSMHFDQPEFGFSFQGDGPLGMLYDPEGPRRRGERDAAEIVNRETEQELARIIFTYGGERRSRKVARAIVEARQKAPIRTTGELARIVRTVVKRSPRDRVDPSTRTFQALRMAANQELEQLQAGLPQALLKLNPGGVAVTIAFHSGEDRICKMTFAQAAGRLTEIHQPPCPEVEFRGRFELLTKKPLRASEAEVRDNPRSRSAKLRAIKRVDDQ